ncbi:hypothetical protein BpHYR1_032567 [Brachionus plicatilis]|uniref:Uncharacterized protein n=1 Tax=Brachionus plicatilis TaxID=10195 RepID=A0A3M7QX56_BRAPC|nr:hypothetical protein BpHYR1_032567 [Brachionus plicatilis]
MILRKYSRIYQNFGKFTGIPVNCQNCILTYFLKILEFELLKIITTCLLFKNRMTPSLIALYYNRTNLVLFSDSSGSITYNYYFILGKKNQGVLSKSQKVFLSSIQKYNQFLGVSGKL